MPKISEQIAVHLSKDQLLDVIKDEVNHLREELDCGINDGVRAAINSRSLTLHILGPRIAAWVHAPIGVAKKSLW